MKHGWLIFLFFSMVMQFAIALAFCVGGNVQACVAWVAALFATLSAVSNQAELDHIKGGGK